MVFTDRPADLSPSAADRARSAAGYAGDLLLDAVCAWPLSYMITGRKHPQEALGLAMTAAAALGRAMRVPSSEQLSVYGALHLAAATAAAACYDRATTEAVLAKARGIANRTGEANHMGTAFGPVNVAIHAISASLRLGDPRTATETGEALDTAAMPVGRIGRRTQVNLDLARAYALCRKDAAAVNLLCWRGAAQSPAGPLRPGDPGGPHRTAAPRAPALDTGTAPSGTSRGRDLTRISYGFPARTRVPVLYFTPLRRLLARPS